MNPSSAVEIKFCEKSKPKQWTVFLVFCSNQNDKIEQNIAKMSKYYKVSIQEKSVATEMFAVKPYLDSFDCFKEEIFIRKPELREKNLRFSYYGKWEIAY